MPNVSSNSITPVQNRSASGSVTLDPARVEALIVQAVGLVSDRHLSELIGISPVTLRRLRTGCPVRTRVVRQFAIALDRARTDASPTMAALLSPAAE